MASIHGYIGLVACGSLSTGSRELGCKVNTCVTGCNPNLWWGSWANYGEGCLSNPNKITATCSHQTSIPRIAYCAADLLIAPGCYASPSTVYGGSIWSCLASRPSRTNAGQGECSPAGTNYLRGGVSAGWADYVYGKNPFTSGHVWAYLAN